MINVEENCWERKLNEMEINRTWADDFIITTTVKFLETNIMVASITNNKEHPWTVFVGDKENSAEIHMCYVNGNHFEEIKRSEGVEASENPGNPENSKTFYKESVIGSKTNKEKK